jgi:prophage maintenance system killer protein
MESLVTIRSRESDLISVSDGLIELPNQYIVNLLAHKFQKNNMRIVKNGLPIFTVLEFLQLNGIPLERVAH